MTKKIYVVKDIFSAIDFIDIEPIVKIFTIGKEANTLTKYLRNHRDCVERDVNLDIRKESNKCWIYASVNESFQDARIYYFTAQVDYKEETIRFNSENKRFYITARLPLRVFTMKALIDFLVNKANELVKNM